MASLFKHRRTTLERAEKFISAHEWTDCNLYGQLYPKRAPVSSLSHRRIYEEGPSGPVHAAYASRPEFSEATKGANFTPVEIGKSFGPTWTTHWFRVEIQIPNDWVGSEVHLRWEADSEALVWTEQGDPLQGLSGDRRDFIISRNIQSLDLKVTLYIEMACNTLFGAGAGSMISPPDPERMFSLQKAEIAVFDRLVYDVIQDLDCIIKMAKHLPTEDPRNYQALYAANNIVNTVTVGDRSTYTAARVIAKEFLTQTNSATQHIIHAIGNCHIDSAWLWTYSETIRKCARSWSSSIRLMEQNKEFTFACSQAQQMAWVKDKYPSLWKKMLAFAKKGQFIPVGGSWVEMDGNIPSGESFIRQFLYGQKFIQENFGKRCEEFWLPDTFGYSAQIPQIMSICGMKWFLTQKLSWSLVNSFPHHNFWWEGIDGTSVLAHFPPGDSYTMSLEVEELLKTVTNLKDKGRVSQSMLLYGHGDGGGGPTDDMLARAERYKNVSGLPKVVLSSSKAFFTALEKESANLCRWVGELYLELHNGTYTTHALVKRNNRKGEFSLRDAELLSVILVATTRNNSDYPKEMLDQVWMKFLLNQFHDVLPGTSIHAVFDEVLHYYEDIQTATYQIKNNALNTLYGLRCEAGCELILVNTLSWERSEVVETPEKSLFAVKISGMTATHITPAEFPPVELKNQLNPYMVYRCRRVFHTGGMYDCFTVKRVNIFIQSSNLKGCLALDLWGFVDGRHSFLKWLANKVSYLWKRRTGPLFYVSVSEDDMGKGGNLELIQAPLKDGFLLQNQYLTAKIDQAAHIVSLKLRDSDKELITSSQYHYGNQLALFDDIPLYWDAWDVMDYHLETRKPQNKVIAPLTILQETSVRVVLTTVIEIGVNSQTTMNITLDACKPYLQFSHRVNWKENHKFLKVEFPIDIMTREATYEIQFGHLKRPTHQNTTWDSAKFEVCGHKWADISEHNLGVAILNDCKYGYSARGSTLSLSLLRAPKRPDAEADMHDLHAFSYAVMPHLGTFQEAGVIQRAYEFNAPLIEHRYTPSKQRLLLPSTSWFSVSLPNVIVEAVKMAETLKDTVVVRLYEAFGSHATVTFNSTFNVHNYQFCNGLEDPIGKKQPWSEGGVSIEFQPFKIQSLLLYVGAVEKPKKSQ